MIGEELRDICLGCWYSTIFFSRLDRRYARVPFMISTTSISSSSMESA